MNPFNNNEDKKAKDRLDALRLSAQQWRDLVFDWFYELDEFVDHAEAKIKQEKGVS